jgi:Stage II sporulation protein
MRCRRLIAYRSAVVLIGVLLVATGTTPVAAAGPGNPVPTPITRPGGLRPDAVAAVAGDCELAGVTCRPQSQTSCTGYSSQTNPPPTIRVLVRTSGTTVLIQTIPFQAYVENVLPNEWLASWDGDALKAGAVAVKSYAWYWVTHFGGYLNSIANCFDVTDDQDFQVYRANSAVDRSTAAVQASWPVAARKGGRILQTFYLAFLSSASEACGASANGSQMSQYGSQACNQANTGNKYNVILGKYYYPGLQLATARQLRTPHDFQFLQKSTRVVFHSGSWAIDDGYPTTFTYGVSGDLPAVTTTGDGFAHIGVFRPSSATWYLAGPTGRTASKVVFGATGDIPVQAQYAGVDKPTVLAIFHPSTGTWYQATSTGAIASKVPFGTKGDIPVPGHYFGTAANDYADGIAVFRPANGTWYFPGRTPVQYGARGDIPMPADYDGNGTTDLAVYRPSTHTFYLRGHAGIQYGATGDIPVTGDFTGDGKADLALYRPSTHTWYVRGASTATFGSSGSTPIGTAPYHD